MGAHGQMLHLIQRRENGLLTHDVRLLLLDMCGPYGDRIAEDSVCDEARRTLEAI